MITVVGAGPAGLALAYYLRRKGLDFQLLDKEETGASWAKYYKHLRLHTRKANVALPGLDLPVDADAFPTREQYLNYLRHYAEHFAFPLRAGTEVLEATYQDGWQLHTTCGCVETDALVLATGVFTNPVVPTFLGQDTFQGELRHAQTYRCPTPYLGRRVLVVGAGNTGVGIALGLAEAGVEVGMVVRDGVQPVPLPTTALGTRLKAFLLKALPADATNWLLGRVRKDYTALGLPQPNKAPRDVVPVVGLEIVEAVKRRRIKIHPAVRALGQNAVRFVDGSEGDYDVLLLATGYQPSLDILSAEVALDAKGQFTNAPPDLYSVGFRYPTLEPFLVAVKREAAVLAAKLAHRDHP